MTREKRKQTRLREVVEFVRDNRSAIRFVQILGRHPARVPATIIQTELKVHEAEFLHVSRGLVAVGVIDRQWQEYGLTNVALLGLTAFGRQVVKAL